ncbi:zinc-binding dehydrogenase [Flavobacterium sp. WC2509]|uniref:zinc-binding dehydrogenase n=1 Tax=Flavobacterium sp. WC2509 TaxID=3461406 RepID=UPI0040445D34
MTSKATAMIFTSEGKPFEKQEVILNDINSNEVIVRIVYTTICTSDLHTFTGRRSTPCPCVLGHEIIGEIISKGQNINKDYNGHLLKIGDLVTWCVYAFDANGKMAKKGIPQKSEDLYKYGHHKFIPEDGLNGGFATHCVLKKGTAIFKLPDFLSHKQSAPINCTHATMAGAIRIAGYLENKNVMITGTGMLGLSACAMAKESGAKNVFALDINPERLAYAKKFGANKFIDAKLSTSEIKSLLSKNEIDVIIDTTGIPSVMETGLEILTIGGTAVWIGAVFSQPATQVNAEMIIRNLLTIKGLHNYTPNDLGYAVDFVSKNHSKYPFEELVGEEFPLEDLTEAFEIAKSGKHYRVGIKQ